MIEGYVPSSMTPGKNRLRRELCEARSEVERLRAALTEVEWSVTSPLGYLLCPGCKQSQSSGHDDDCPVGLALAWD